MSPSQGGRTDPDGWTLPPTSRRRRRPTIPRALLPTADTTALSATLAAQRVREAPLLRTMRALGAAVRALAGGCVTTAICLGLGPLAAVDGAAADGAAARRSLTQMLCFLELAAAAAAPAAAPHCTFQEPRFGAAERALLAGLGHEVVDSPAAFAAVGPHALLFAVHVARDVCAAALAHALPAVFVGTAPEAWNDDGAGADAAAAARVAELAARSVRLAMPQADDPTVFSSTCVYVQVQ